MALKRLYLLPSPEHLFSDQGSDENTGETQSCCKFYRRVQRPRWILLPFFRICRHPFLHFSLAFLPLTLFSTLTAVLGIPLLNSAVGVLQKELQDKTGELNALKQQLQGSQGKDFSQSKRLFKGTFDVNDYIQQSTAYSLKLWQVLFGKKWLHCLFFSVYQIIMLQNQIWNLEQIGRETSQPNSDLTGSPLIRL